MKMIERVSEMDEFYDMLIRKIEIGQLKMKVLDIILSLKYDGVYSFEHAIEDLTKLAKNIEEMESPMDYILKSQEEASKRPIYT
jgi:hypothetical protein